MGVFSEWSESRERRRRAAAYLRRLSLRGTSIDTQWLTRAGSTELLADRELRFMHRAMALIVSERDALDDRTASEVARSLAPTIASEAVHSPETGRLWADRWREYTAALAVRGTVESPSARLARVLIAGAGIAGVNAELLTSATHAVQAARNVANESLRAAFGVASLPDDVRPSAINS